MCRYSVLAHNATGYFIQCKDCGHFQFAFGTTELIMTGAEVYSFYERLSANIVPQEERSFCDRKSIRLRFPDSKIALALTPFEAKQLLAMIDEARATLAVNNLLCD